MSRIPPQGARIVGAWPAGHDQPGARREPRPGHARLAAARRLLRVARRAGQSMVEPLESGTPRASTRGVPGEPTTKRA